MSKRLYEIVNSSHVKLNEDFVNESYELLLSEENDLKEFINDFRIDYNIMGFGSYSNEDRIICINPEKIINDKPFSNIDYNNKILILRVLRHEMEHARNLRTLFQGRNDIESRIIRYSLIDYIQKHNPNSDIPIEDYEYLKLIKYQNYEFDPGERIADIRANKYIVNLLKNQRVTNDLLIARSLLYYSYVRGYRDNNYYLDAPTYTFLCNMGLLYDYTLIKKLVDSGIYSLETRATLGLPLTYNEKEKELLKKARLQRRS